MNNKYTKSLIDIFSRLILEAKATGNSELIQEEHFLEEVMKAGLATTAKEWFELGVMAIKFHDFAPQGYLETLKKLKVKME